MRAIAFGLLLFSLPTFAADDLGRLFFTPEQRAMLDLARRTQPKATQTSGEPNDGVTLSGIVTRNDGRRTVWINGQPQVVAPGGSTNSASIPLPSGEGRIRLKVGQTLDTASGKVEEGYRRPPKSEPAMTAPGAPVSKVPVQPPAPKDDDASADNASDSSN